MKKLIFAGVVLTIVMGAAAGAIAQSKSIPASEIVEIVSSGKAVTIKNATVAGDLDLTNLPVQVNDAIYRENGKTARVFSNKIVVPVTFKNVVFTGELKFFRSESDANELREFRVAFEDKVEFENCVFEKTANFELTNFDSDVSFAYSVFKEQPLIVRVGLAKTANLEGTMFEKGSVFQFTQNDRRIDLSAEELRGVLTRIGGK